MTRQRIARCVPSPRARPPDPSGVMREHLAAVEDSMFDVEASS